MSALPKSAAVDPKYEALVERWRNDFYAFAEEVLGKTYFTPDQHRLIDSYMANRYTACTSGQGTGKTHALACIVHHFTVTNPDSLVVTTSSSWELLEDALWPEIRSLYHHAKIPIGGKLLDFSLTFDDQWMVISISTNDPNAFHGKHARRVLVVIDEAEGVPDFAFVGAEAMAVGPDDRIIASANPIDPTSAFHAEVLKPADPSLPRKWNRVIIDCENHPNVLTGQTIVPGAVSRTRVEEWRRDYGEDHPTFIARVKGDWSSTLGRLFPDWNEARHTFDPSKVVVQPWWPHWISIDWGFAHNSVALFFAYDGRTVHVYDELVANGVVAGTFGDMVGRMANPLAAMGGGQKFDAVYLAHDAFGHAGETQRTRAEMMSESLILWGLPAAVRASVDRIGGFNLITALLRNDTLKVSTRCRELIKKMPLAMRDPKKPEDALKVEGDDEVDALYKGVIARPGALDIPPEVQIAQSITATTPHGIAMQSRVLAAQHVMGGEPAFASMRRAYQ